MRSSIGVLFKNIPRKMDEDIVYDLDTEGSLD